MAPRKKSEFHGYISSGNNVIVKPIEEEISNEKRYLEPIKAESLEDARRYYKGNFFNKKVRFMKEKIAELKLTLEKTLRELINTEENYDRVQKNSDHYESLVKKKEKDIKDLKDVGLVVGLGFIIVTIQFFML